MISDKALIPILISVLSLIWGSSYILMTIGLKSFTPYEVSAWRYVFALLAIAPFALRKLTQISRSDWPWIIVVTFVGTGFPGIIYPTAVQYVDSSVIGIINAFAWPIAIRVIMRLTKIKSNFSRLLNS